MELNTAQKVTAEEIDACFKFAEDLYEKKAASQKQFGRGDIIRGKNDFIADHVLGKAAEYALSRFLNNHFGFQFKVDMNVWNNPLVHDEGHDLSVFTMDGQTYHLPIKVDVKGTRERSKWLVVEKHKITVFQTQVYIIVRILNIPTGKRFEENPYNYKGRDWDTKIEGYAMFSDLMEPSSETGWFEFNEGDRLYNPDVLIPLRNVINKLSTVQFHKELKSLLFAMSEQSKYIGPPLDCKVNFGLPLNWLRNDMQEWQDFVCMLRRDAVLVHNVDQSFVVTTPETLGHKSLDEGVRTDYMEEHSTSYQKGSSMEIYSEGVDSPMLAKDTEPKHSLLAVLSQEDIYRYTESLAPLMKKGIKVLLFTEKAEEHIPVCLTAFQPSRLLQLYKVSPDTTIRFSGNLFVDGVIQDSQRPIFSQLTLECSAFNEEQYNVEHASPNVHLCVEAGAGTGKTTVMIDRILFLIHTTSLPISEMAMITFTREAAQNMFHKLRNAFFQRYQATGAVRYLQLMEDLRFMRISTIHSFAKQLIRELGSELGYGQNVQIRSFRTERRQIIEQQIDTQAKKWLQQHSIMEKFKDIPLHKMISITDSFWTELERKGLTREETAHISWGDAAGDSRDLHELFSEVFAKCEEEFHQLKTSANAVSLSDLTRQVELVSRREEAFKNTTKRISYLFIDEFQDTDDSQIKLAARLVKALKLKLFVVGDIKQSIYRFRGADYTAFDNLRRLMEEQNETVKPFSLRKNYRSAASILNDMDRHFSAWGRAEHLTYRENDRLVGMRSSSEAAVNIFKVDFKRHSEDQKRYTIDLIRRAKDSMTRPKKDKIALLVRTNAQAGRLKAWCDEAGINTQLEIGGTFFTSHAVQDFACLIDALLFSKNPAALVNLLNSPYSQAKVHWSALVPFDGDEEGLLAFLNSILPFDGWNNIQEKLRIKPVLSVIRMIMEAANPAMWYLQEQRTMLEEQRPGNSENAEEATIRSIQYQKNLNHLLELLHQQYSTDFLSLYSLHTWLHMNMAINRDEDEPELDEEEKGNRLRIITVHKSKGLEFHTVILPFTEQDFRYERSELLLDRRDGTWVAGWQIKDNGRIFSSLTYSTLTSNESIEVQREEARLLYVAMTRSEERLWIVRNIKYSGRDNWSRLLGMQGDIQ
ncbi:ATP-dependent helicase [Brevibacillus choshinensis]|uniref:UvrD-helicase domain-containing protein n=1 Tax=Brevibacillus choshinensis TaxID=54911 RepID=UPI002E1BDC1D|nr:ATP-dependent helicase [Brevibacillus choshinensis]